MSYHYKLQSSLSSTALNSTQQTIKPFSNYISTQPLKSLNNPYIEKKPLKFPKGKNIRKQTSMNTLIETTYYILNS